MTEAIATSFITVEKHIESIRSSMEGTQLSKSSYSYISYITSSTHETCMSVLEDVSLPGEPKGELPMDDHLSL
jgi:hypothetical protein